MAEKGSLGQRTVIRNVNIFDGISDSVAENSDVVLEGNRITAVSSSPVGDAPGQETVDIDGGGRFLMPGMTDAHVHLMGNANGFISCGDCPDGAYSAKGADTAISTALHDGLIRPFP